MRNFSVRGYIINVDGNKVTLRVDDSDIERVSFIASFHKKTPIPGNFITVNVRTAKYDIKNLEWNELTDLKGVHVHVECTARVSQFIKKLNAPKSIEKDGYIPDMNIVKMVSFVARSVKNVDSES